MSTNVLAPSEKSASEFLPRIKKGIIGFRTSANRKKKSSPAVLSKIFLLIKS